MKERQIKFPKVLNTTVIREQRSSKKATELHNHSARPLTPPWLARLSQPDPLFLLTPQLLVPEADQISHSFWCGGGSEVPSGCVLFDMGAGMSRTTILQPHEVEEPSLLFQG